MARRNPIDIWTDSLEEGEHRLARNPLGLAATGFAGGAEVLLGILALVVTTAGLARPLGQEGAHVAGSVFFGIAFVFITAGRAELFTENFLIPVGAVRTGRSSWTALLRMWGLTLLTNLLGLVLLAAIFSYRGVLEPGALHAAGSLADVYTSRSALAALLSAVAAGAVMTLFTWVTAAAEDGISRLALAIFAGFLLGAPSLNHAVVSFGEIVFGLIAGTAQGAAGDLLRNLGLAIVGNLIGGVGLVYGTRVLQIRGEPEHAANSTPSA